MGRNQPVINLLIDPPYRRRVRADWLHQVASETLRGQDLPQSTEVSIYIAGDELVSDLNQRYRGKEGTTDVLSFSLNGMADGEEFVSPPEGTYNLGEVIVSYPQAERQALEHGHSPEHEVALLIVHGIFHLMGHDHEDEDEAKIMRELESRALSRVGIDRALIF